MQEKTVKSSRIHRGRILDLDLIEVELAPGRRATREVVRHRGAVAILARLGPAGDFVFVRQFRKPVELEVIEAAAGCMEPGETPEACAARELAEETGLAADSMERLGSVWTSPGYSDELLHLFYAQARRGSGAESPDEDEHIEALRLSETQVEEMMRSGQIKDAKTLAAWLLLKLRTGKEGRPAAQGS